MATSEAQKRAVKNYRERNGGTAAVQKTIGATFGTAEAEEIKSILHAAGITPAQLYRRAIRRILDGDDLTRIYNPDTHALEEPPQD